MKNKPISLLRRICLAVFVTVAALMGLYKFITSVDNLPQSLGKGFGIVVSAFAPILVGLVISYFLQPLVNWEQKVFAKLFPKTRPIPRLNVAIILAMVLFVAFLGTTVGLLLPMVYSNASDLILHADDWLLRGKEGLIQLQERFPLLGFLDAETLHQNVVSTVDTWISQADWGSLALQAAGVVGKVVSVVVNIFVGIILAIYILRNGHELAASIRETLNGWFGEAKMKGFFDCIGDIDRIFGRYVGGKMLQSFVMFLIILPFFLVLKVPYAPLMALIVALSNLIPFIGPLLGSIVPVFFTLLISPLRAVLTLAAVVLVQQIDNYLIEPKLIGKVVGMHSFWVIAWVIIGSSFFGVWGTLLAVPTVAVIKAILDRLLNKKKDEAHENRSGD